MTDPERFAMLLAEHFLAEYSWVLAAKIGVRMHPWERMRVEDGIHNHAFISNPVYERFTTVRSSAIYYRVGLTLIGVCHHLALLPNSRLLTQTVD